MITAGTVEYFLGFGMNFLDMAEKILSIFKVLETIMTKCDCVKLASEFVQKSHVAKFALKPIQNIVSFIDDERAKFDKRFMIWMKLAFQQVKPPVIIIFEEVKLHVL